MFESIFQLEGTSFVDSEKKVIELEMNPKEPDLMRKLNKGLCVLNEMDVHDVHGRVVQFKLAAILKSPKLMYEYYFVFHDNDVNVPRCARMVAPFFTFDLTLPSSDIIWLTRHYHFFNQYNSTSR